MAINLEGIVTWLKGWFYDKTEITGFLNNKANQSDLQTLQGTVTSLGETVAGKIDTAGTGLTKSGTTLNHSNSITAQTSAVFKKIKYDAQGHITGTADVQVTDFPHSHNATGVLDANAHSNLGTSANANQGEINTAIDSIIGSMSSIRAIEVVTTLPTASASTLGKLYIISENSKVNVYYTEQSGSSYSWHKMDTDILDELSVAWNDITGKPSSFTPSSHTHGNLTNDGKIGNTANKVIITGTGGSLTAVSTIGATNVADVNAHNYIGSSANATQSTINTKINTAIGDKVSITDFTWANLGDKPSFAPVGHYHNDNEIISQVELEHIGTAIADSQRVVNQAIDSALSNMITSIALVDKATDSSGKIIFYTGDEPT